MIRPSRCVGPLSAFLVVTVLGTATAAAHHSYAMFDRSKRVTLSGLVRIWEFSNPHAYLWLYVKNDKGDFDLYGLEAPGPSQLVRSGWNKNTVKPGDPVTVIINPLADGRTGGNLVKVTLADGRSLDSAAPPPSAVAPAGAT